MEVMSFEEFRKQAIEFLRKELHAFPNKEVDDYIKSLEDNIKKRYDQGIASMEITGCAPSPSGYAYGASLEF